MVRCRSFSLLEMLVVLVVISLLALFGHATYLAYIERAKISEAFNVLEDYQSIAEGLRAQSGTIAPYYVLFTDTNQSGLLTGSPTSTSASKQLNLEYVNNIFAFSGTDGSGDTYILLGAEMQHDGIFVTGADFVYVAGIQTTGGEFYWECGISASQGNTVTTEYLPATCQANLP